MIRQHTIWCNNKNVASLSNLHVAFPSSLSNIPNMPHLSHDLTKWQFSFMTGHRKYLVTTSGWKWKFYPLSLSPFMALHQTASLLVWGPRKIYCFYHMVSHRAKCEKASTIRKTDLMWSNLFTSSLSISAICGIWAP